MKPSSINSGCLYAADAKFACDYVRRLVPTLTALGTSPTQSTMRWERGGYKVYTSIDLSQQDVATAALRTDAPATEKRFDLGASAVSIRPGTGRILVMAQNKGFDNSGPGAVPPPLRSTTTPTRPTAAPPDSRRGRPARSSPSPTGCRTDTAWAMS